MRVAPGRPCTSSDWVCHEQRGLRRELERSPRQDVNFDRPLEAEPLMPATTSARTWAPRPSWVSRAEDGSINVFENRCAHRGAEFCRHNQGNAKEFVCPYHQWSYDLKGNLQGIPFRRASTAKAACPRISRTTSTACAACT